MSLQKPKFARNSAAQNLVATIIAPKSSLSHLVIRRFDGPRCREKQSFFGSRHKKDAGVSFEHAQGDQTGFSQSLKALANIMSSEAGATYHDDTPIGTVETPHLRINLPIEPSVSLETMRLDDTQSANRNGGADRYEEGEGQIAHKSGFEFACIDREVGVFDMNIPNQGPVARLLHAREGAPGLEKTHIALNGLMTVFGNTKHLGRRDYSE